MIPSYDPDHFETAVRRFRRFFEELQETFVERDSVLTQCGLALLCRQHVLMTGPPGTAKSQLAAMVLGRIIDESTGNASLFSRQFTENTVQTDLVGSIDFKTLMESGRTEHFTDEGMLGSVHAFLDEVLDGRDMLLRSTLNILHERELKQGQRTTKGKIECAFMTSNRYIAEVLDSSRETLLAFIDRISFISFIPRGFAQPQSMQSVVRRHGGRFGRHQPTAYLSVQDIDVLQAAADLVYVPEEICDAVAVLVGALDAELAAAQRSDPKFQPTRYLSTRSAVVATEVLRAVAVYDKIFHRPDRPLQVEHDDLAWLRYVLLLNGVERQAIAACLERETDPRERRQLDIMATEAELFERCYARLPRVEVPPQPRRLELGALKSMTNQARNSGDPEALATAVDALLGATESGAADANQAARMLVDTVGTLTAQALRAGLSPSLEGEAFLGPVAEGMSELADKLEQRADLGRPMAMWLRGRLLGLLDEALRLTPATSSNTVELLAGQPAEGALTQQIRARLDATERLIGMRRQLTGPEHGATTSGEDPLPAALGKLEEELVLLWDAKLRTTAVNLLEQSADTPLAKVLQELQPVLAELQQDSDRYESFGKSGDLLRRVTGPRLEPIVARAFRRLDGANRKNVVEQVEAVAGELRTAGLDQVISSDRFVAWTVPALVRAEPSLDETRPAVHTREDYDAARSREPEICITDTLVQIAVSTLAASELSSREPARATDSVWAVLRNLEPSERQRVLELDLARVRRGIEDLETWWNAVTQGPVDDDDPAAAVALFERVVQSGFLRAMRGDVLPLQLTAELNHLVEAFPSSGEAGAELRRRLAQLDAESTKTMVAQLQAHSDRAWSRALDPEAS